MMTTTAITIEATLQPDGLTLQLEKKLPLPPGGVTVTVQPKAEKSGPAMLEVLDRIHQDQHQRRQPSDVRGRDGRPDRTNARR